ncbi:MAG: hypothetical protein KDE19_04065 [Caldilineaceae bacterium]|nr:hypothetical protein [Caldilineaceae bacterium]
MFLFYLPIIILVVIGLILARWRVMVRKRRRLQGLRTWARQSLALDPVLQQWLQQMSPAQFEVLLDLLDGYCVSLNWKLDWLFTPHIKNAPVLYSALEESLSAYARTILLSLQTVEDVHAYEAFLAFDKQPNARKQSALVQQLYAKLQHEGVAPQPKGRFFRRFSNETPTHSDRVDAIRQAFAQNPARAMAFLKEVLATEQTGATVQTPQRSTNPIDTISMAAVE